MTVQKIWKMRVTAAPNKRLGQPNLDEVRINKQAYYKGRLAGFDFCFYFPDARTVVCSSREQQLRERIERGASEQPGFLRGDDWRQIDRGLMAIAIDNRQNRWKLDVSNEDPEDLQIAPLLQNASRWVIGADASDVLKLHAVATCPGESQAETIARLARDRMTRAQLEADGQLHAGSTEDDRASTALSANGQGFDASLHDPSRRRRGGPERRTKGRTRCARGVLPSSRAVLGPRREGRLRRLAASHQRAPAGRSHRSVRPTEASSPGHSRSRACPS